MSAAELLASRITAPGEGGLGVFRVVGPGLDGFLARTFRAAGRRPPSGGELRHGHLVDGGSIVDEVVVALEPGGAAVEIATHGGESTARAVESLLARAGARLVGAERVGPRARGRAPAVALEAGRALREARSSRALHFFAGAADSLESEILSLVAIARALPSAALDRRRAATAALCARLETLQARAACGRALASPPLVLLTGAPNAGKSTLLNALAASDRAIVTAEAGTTRDLVEEEVSLLGHPFRVADSAGIREGARAVEAAGIARALAAADRAAVVVLVLDGSSPPPDLAWVAPFRSRTLIAVSKCDLPRHPETDLTAAAIARPLVRTSGATGSGLADLARAILAHSPFRGPASADLPCPFTLRQESLIAAALEALSESGTAAADRLQRLLEEDLP